MVPSLFALCEDLILEVESTMKKNEAVKYSNMPPFLHILKPINLEGSRPEEGDDMDRWFI
jgi:hypothetical protein